MHARTLLDTENRLAWGSQPTEILLRFHSLRA
eukprot:COSAG01_NODE_23538_length_811_cov_1.872191_1_plen_31_part_10